MNDKLSRQNCVLYVCGIIPVVWLALLAAPLLEGGLGTLLEGFGTALENPFHIVWCDKSLKTLLIFLMLYGLGIGIYVSNERVYRRREEQGSARWGNPLSIAKRYQQSGNANKLLTQQMALGRQEAPSKLKCPDLRWFRCRQDSLLREAEYHAGQHLLRDSGSQG